MKKLYQVKNKPVDIFLMAEDQNAAIAEAKMVYSNYRKEQEAWEA
jgi:hypothetical protein